MCGGSSVGGAECRPKGGHVQAAKRVGEECTGERDGNSLTMQHPAAGVAAGCHCSRRRGREEQEKQEGAGQINEKVKPACQDCQPCSQHNSNFPYSAGSQPAQPGTHPNQSNCPIESTLGSARLSWLISPAHFGHKPI